jgi:transposase
MRDQLPELSHLNEAEKDALIAELWEESQMLRAAYQGLGEEHEVLRAKVVALEQRLARLEAKLSEPPRTARNSSVPPSQGPKGNRPEKPKGMRRQASVGRAGGGRELHPEPDQEVVALAKVCPHCGGPVAACEQKLMGVYDKIELPPVRPFVTRVTQYGGQCGGCGKGYLAPVPVGMEAGSPFGNSVASLATYFRYGHAISYERLTGMFRDVFGLTISEGALANLFERAARQFDPATQAILERLRRSRLVASDETSVRVNGRNQWEWVFQNDEVCLHVIRPSRGAGVIEEVLAGHRPQVWVSDLYSSQKTHPAQDWQVCLAHQLRDCQLAIDAGDTIFAPRMKAILLRAFVIHKRRDHLADSTHYQYRCDLNRRLQAALALSPTNPHGIRLHKRYAQLTDHLFLFLKDASIPPTNNQSERALRPSKIFRKVTNGFRSVWGRDLFASIRSVVNTGQRHGLNAFESITKTLSLPSPDFLFRPG